MFFINKARDPNIIFPISGINRLVFLKNIIKNPQIIVGDYTYYDDPENVYFADRFSSKFEKASLSS